MTIKCLHLLCRCKRTGSVTKVGENLTTRNWQETSKQCSHTFTGKVLPTFPGVYRSVKTFFQYFLGARQHLNIKANGSYLLDVHSIVHCRKLFARKICSFFTWSIGSRRAFILWWLSVSSRCLIPRDCETLCHYTKSHWHRHRLFLGKGLKTLQRFLHHIHMQCLHSDF